jgi:hypothetical protein
MNRLGDALQRAVQVSLKGKQAAFSAMADNKQSIKLA